MKMRWPFKVLVLAVVGVIVWLFAFGTRTPDRFDEGDAWTACVEAIRLVARDPETAEIPYVRGARVQGEYYFAWGRSTRFARMRNGLGREVPVSAACTVDPRQEKITVLTVDGKTVI